MRHYDAVIIGGGPAGTTTAISLLSEAVEAVLILESTEYTDFVIGESIPPQSKSLFLELGIWKDFLKEQHLPSFGVCSYWGSEKRGYNDTILSPYGHGWHLDRSKFNLFLAEKAIEFGAELETRSVFKSSKMENNSHYISYESNGQIHNVRADFVVDATGHRSLFARTQGSIQLHGEPLVCLGRRFKLDENTQVSHLTRIETTELGWWYAARLPNKEMLVTMYSTAANVKEHQLQLPDNWIKELRSTQSILDGVLESNALDKKIKGFKVPSFCLNKSADTNWIAVGDSASSYDPITSRGIYKSMQNAIKASQYVSDFFTKGSYDHKEYDLHIKTKYYHYLTERASYYRNENRWENNSFWKRFHQLENPAMKKVQR